MGDEPLVLQSIISSSAQFVVQSVALPLTIAPHESVSIKVKYTSLARGAGSGDLLITSNDPNKPQFSIPFGRAALHKSHGRCWRANHTFRQYFGYRWKFLSFAIIPNPDYQLSALLVDGVNVENSSTNSGGLTLTDVVPRTILVRHLSPHNSDYFGMQVGNRFYSYLPNANISQTDDISLDTTSFTYLAY